MSNTQIPNVMRPAKRQRNHMIKVQLVDPHATTTQMADHPVTSHHIRTRDITTTTKPTPLRRTLQLVRRTIATLRAEPGISTHRPWQRLTTMHTPTLRLRLFPLPPLGLPPEVVLAGTGTELCLGECAYESSLAAMALNLALDSANAFPCGLSETCTAPLMAVLGLRRRELRQRFRTRAVAAVMQSCCQSC